MKIDQIFWPKFTNFALYKAYSASKRNKMSDVYYSIAGPGQGKFTEKMSKFLSFAYAVDTADDARARIAEIARRYHDARHVCWAYMLGPELTDCMLNDNGEPSGTAGKPILGQINSFQVTDVVVIVVRYFGGIKLGTSGLIAAYREAARLALDDAGKVELHVMDTIGFTYPYMSMNSVMKLIKQSGITIISQTFDNVCEVRLTIRMDEAPRLRAALGEIDGLTFL